MLQTLIGLAYPSVKLIEPTNTVGLCPDLLDPEDIERYRRTWDRSAKYRRGAEKGIASVLEQIQ